MDAKAIGEALQQRRKELNLTQPIVAMLSQVGLNTLVAIERGTGNPKLATLLAVAETLGYEINVSLKN